MADRVDITVIICTWNRAALLDQTLAALAAVAPPPGKTWELLVVDNNSPDRTPEVIAAHARAGRLPLRGLREAKQGQSHARNRGLDEARGDWVVWTDDDVRPDPGWLEGFAATADRHPDAAAVGGPIRPWFPHPPDPDLVAVFPPLAIGYCGVDHGPAERELAADEPIYGANMAVNARLVGELRFDTRLGRRGACQTGGDDLEHVDRVRLFGPVVWSPAMRLEHYVSPERLTLGYVKRYIQDGLITWTPPDGDPSPTLFGVPRWLVRKYLAAAAGEWGWRPRADRLRSRIDRWRMAAMISGYRRTTSRRGAV